MLLVLYIYIYLESRRYLVTILAYHLLEIAWLVGICIKVPGLGGVIVDYLACKLRAWDTGDGLSLVFSGADILGWSL